MVADIQEQVDAHVLRMHEEEAQLQLKIQKLTAFTATHTYDALPMVEQHLLASQLFVMQSYASILGARLNLAVANGVTVPAN